MALFSLKSVPSVRQPFSRVVTRKSSGDGKGSSIAFHTRRSWSHKSKAKRRTLLGMELFEAAPVMPVSPTTSIKIAACSGVS
jgi:hypothetical protein